MQVVDGGEERIWKVGVISGHYCAFMGVRGDCRTGTGVRRWRELMTALTSRLSKPRQ
jgi:hypothetical protein